MASIKLSDLQAAANEKFGDYVVDLNDDGSKTATFKPALRLAKAARRKVSEAVNLEARIAKAVETGDEDDDLYEMFKDVFRLSEARKGEFAKLEKAVGDDPAVWTELFSDFGDKAQSGEAAPSAN